MFSRSKIYFTATGEFVNNKKAIIENFDLDTSNKYVIKVSENTFLKFNESSPFEKSEVQTKEEASKFKEIIIFESQTNDNKHHLILDIDIGQRPAPILVAEGGIGNLSFKLIDLMDSNIEDKFDAMKERYTIELGLSNRGGNALGLMFIPLVAIYVNGIGLSEEYEAGNSALEILKTLLINLQLNKTDSEIDELVNKIVEDSRLLFIDFLNSNYRLVSDGDLNSSNKKIINLDTNLEIQNYTQGSRHVPLQIQQEELVENVTTNDIVENDMEVRNCLNTFNGLTLEEIDQLPENLRNKLRPFIQHLLN
jgi:hypothetical protein